MGCSNHREAEDRPSHPGAAARPSTRRRSGRRPAIPAESMLSRWRRRTVVGCAEAVRRIPGAAHLRATPLVRTPGCVGGGPPGPGPPGPPVQVRPGPQVHPARRSRTPRSTRPRCPPGPPGPACPPGPPGPAGAGPPGPQAHPAPRVHQVHRVPPGPDRQVLQVRAHPAPHVHRIHRAQVHPGHQGHRAQARQAPDHQARPAPGPGASAIGPSGSDETRSAVHAMASTARHWQARRPPSVQKCRRLRQSPHLPRALHTYVFAPFRA